MDERTETRMAKNSIFRVTLMVNPKLEFRIEFILIVIPMELGTFGPFLTKKEKLTYKYFKR